MLPTIINLMIPARIDIPAEDWKNHQNSILQEIIQNIPNKKIELLTFNTEEMLRAYKVQEKDTILLQIKVEHPEFAAKGNISFKDRILGLLNSKMVTINNYARKLKRATNSSHTIISINVGVAA